MASVRDNQKNFHLLKFCVMTKTVWIYILLGLLCFEQVRSQCQDGFMCSYMASEGECERDPEYMLEECPKACKNPCKCDVSAVSQDTACDCLIKAKEGYCETPESKIDCATTCADVSHINCPALPMPQDPNARLSTWSTSYLTTVTEICNDGYQPVQPMDRGEKMCQSDGTWSSDYFYGNPVECQLVDCGQPPTSSNTFPYYTATSYGSTVDYTCRTGYVSFEGQATLTCQANGTWGGQPLQCRRIDCGLPPTSSNADVTYTNTYYGNKAQYACANGYELSSGDTTLTCGKSETWEGTLIVCEEKSVDCGNPPVSSNTILDVTTTTEGSTANYTCAEGYEELKGQTILTCNASGLWDGELLTCTKIDCGPPPDSANAFVTFNGTFYEGTADYACATGYNHTRGDTTLTCGKTGTWDGNAIVCTIIDCKDPPTSPHTTLQVSGTTYGETANYTCQIGYTPYQGDTTLTCEDDGEWTGEILSCSIVECGVPPVSSNTKVDFENTTYGSVANYTCADGYTEVEGEATLTCNASGSWEGELLRCSKIDCGPPPDSQNAISAFNGTFYNDIADYACVTGYEHSHGDPTLTCGVSGTWEGNVIGCTIIDCKTPPTSAHTTLQVSGTTYGDTAKYTCQIGYAVLQGDATLTCEADGKWTGEVLTCTIVDCGTPPSSPNTEVDVGNTTYGSTADYTCAEGYLESQGQKTLTCNASGLWEGKLCTCAIIDCNDPPSDSSLAVQVTDTTYNQTADYSCAVGYKYVSGDTTMVCDESGSWKGQLMTCIAKDCGTPSVGNLSDVTYTSTTYGSRAVYKCDLGHERVDGDEVRTCQDDETWSGNALVCLPVVCGAPPVFAGARMWVLDGEGHHKYKDKCHYECFYEPEGREGMQWTLECGPAKKWIGEEPECGAASPVKPEQFNPEPSEAPASWAIGVGIFCILATFIVLFIVIDLTNLRKHAKYMKKNVKHFKKDILKKWSNFRARAQWKPTVLTSNGMIEPMSPPTSTLFPSMMSVHIDGSTRGSNANSVAGSARSNSLLTPGQTLSPSRSAVSLTSLANSDAPETMTSVA